MADIEQKIVLRAVDRTSGELARVKQGMKAIDDENKNLVTSFRGVSSGVGVAMGAFTALGGYMTGTFVRSLIDTEVAVNKVKNALMVGTGSAGMAQREFEFLRQESKRLGLDFESVAQTYGKLTAATKNTALSLKDTREIFLATAEAGTAMGMTAQDMEGSLNAFLQMVSKGNVQAEELRGQLGERLAGAFDLSAKAMGVTTRELNKMLDNGEVLASDLLPKMAKEMRNTFGGQALNGATQMQAEINRFKNGWFELKQGILDSGAGDAITRVFRGLGGYIQDAADKLNLFNKSLGVGQEATAENQKRAWALMQTLKTQKDIYQDLNASVTTGSNYTNLYGNAVAINKDKIKDLNTKMMELDAIMGKGTAQKFLDSGKKEQEEMAKTAFKKSEAIQTEIDAEEKRKSLLKSEEERLKGKSGKGGGNALLKAEQDRLDFTKETDEAILDWNRSVTQQLLAEEQQRADDERMVNDFILETNQKFYSEKEKRDQKYIDFKKKKSKEQQDIDNKLEAQKIDNIYQTTGVLLQAGQTLFQGNKKFALLNKSLALGEITVNTAKAVTSALPNIPLSIAMGVLGGAQFVKAASVKYAAKGADFITNGPQLMMVGENAGGKERVQVTPLSSPNIDGPKNSSSNVSFGNINIVVNNGNDFANMLRNNPDEFNALMKEGLRRGALKGIV